MIIVMDITIAPQWNIINMEERFVEIPAQRENLTMSAQNGLCYAMKKTQKSPH